jgi:hypothetical protein
MNFEDIVVLGLLAAVVILVVRGQQTQATTLEARPYLVGCPSGQVIGTDFIGNRTCLPPGAVS